MRRLRHRYSHALGGEVCGEYRTRSGKVGAIIKRHNYGGRVSYSYNGEWGAGSGHDAAYIHKEIAYWHERKRGMKVIIPFTP